MKISRLVLAVAALPSIAAAQGQLGPSQQSVMPPPSKVEIKTNRTSEIPKSEAGDRVTYVAPFAGRGTGVPIAMADITRLCGDKDGCSVRLAMFNWDGTGRTASREFLFFFNPTTHGWRASTDSQGFDDSNVVEHVNQAWACYFTDGEYAGWNGTDLVAGFQLLVWNEYNADCWITIIE